MRNLIGRDGEWVNEVTMWWTEHWLELAAVVAFVGSWADLRSRVNSLVREVEAQNGRIGKAELLLENLRGHAQERETWERRAKAAAEVRE